LPFRISDETFIRLQAAARPLEDTADDVVRLALDALEKMRGAGRPVDAPKIKKPRRRGNKTPLRDFRLPLTKVRLELGGSAEVHDIRKKMLPAVKDRLTKDDHEPVSTGERGTLVECDLLGAIRSRQGRPVSQ